MDTNSFGLTAQKYPSFYNQEQSLWSSAPFNQNTSNFNTVPNNLADMTNGTASTFSPTTPASSGSIFDNLNGKVTWTQAPDGSWNSSYSMGLKDYANMGLQGLQTLGNLYLGYQSAQLAKDQLAFSKDAFAKNWEANKLAYNTAIEDRARNRAKVETGSTNSAQHNAWAEAHKLKD